MSPRMTDDQDHRVTCPTCQGSGHHVRHGSQNRLPQPIGLSMSQDPANTQGGAGVAWAITARHCRTCDGVGSVMLSTLILRRLIDPVRVFLAPCRLCKTSHLVEVAPTKCPACDQPDWRRP